MQTLGKTFLGLHREGGLASTRIGVMKGVAKIMSLEKEFREYKRKASERMTRLEERIVRLERKEAESRGDIKLIPDLYLGLEDIKEKQQELWKIKERLYMCEKLHKE